MDKPIDLLGDTIRDAIMIDAAHAEQCDAFDAAAAAYALLADRARWAKYVKLAHNLGLRDADAVVFCAAATPPLRKGREAADPIRAAIFAAAEAEGRGPYARRHGAAVVALPTDDPTEGIAYDIAGGMDYHTTGRAPAHSKAPAPAVGPVASDRTLRRVAKAKREAREAGQGFFAGLGFRNPQESDDDGLLPEGV